MNKFNLTVAIFVSAATGAQAQLITGGGSSEINVNTGAGTVVNQQYGGDTDQAANSLSMALLYTGTYLNPRVDETDVATVNGFNFTFSTNAQPVDLTSITIGVDTGQTVNSGGPVVESDCTTSVGITAAVQEVLAGGVLLNTGYQAAVTGTLSGNGILDFSSLNSAVFTDYILRPDTTYALTVAISGVMTFTNTANVPSMGVTQEYFNAGSNVTGAITFAAAPEPPAYAALGVGLLGFACMRRRRK